MEMVICRPSAKDAPCLLTSCLSGRNEDLEGKISVPIDVMDACAPTSSATIHARQTWRTCDRFKACDDSVRPLSGVDWQAPCRLDIVMVDIVSNAKQSMTRVPETRKIEGTWEADAMVDNLPPCYISAARAG
ncbi:uncharacterized protein LAESUDRAFT_765573 [Laetiporus sulphureus 93-53]|uniref:Uncharacterized protein n=1 Tax=Laetiporus sulphureus 93-53 TaxID=1314785 RepID=A0A165APE5_9APHY|nr:uncharacterized protein LAESUDRAFT_765573 [Laetiporus sulphureus 93-53]KZS99404.1 hypothetical protein LAESUDRAFT_765573 [Laetiporus sulphureus 93-53]